MLIILLWTVLSAYVLSAIFYWRSFFNGHLETASIARNILILSVFLHLSFIVYFIINLSRIPIATVSETIQIFVWLTAILYLLIEARLKEKSQGSLILSLLIVLLFISNVSFDVSNTINPILYDVKYEVHVFAILLGYSGFTLSFIASILHILLSAEIRKKEPGMFFRKLPSLAYFERISNYAVNVGLVFLLLGFILGFYAAAQVWTFSEITDVKILSVLLTLIIYSLHFLGQKTGKIRGQRAAVISLVGFTLILISFLIISNITPGAHQFG